jgi:hypothetical protein
LSFTIINYEPKKSTAEVEQQEGIYIFTDSKPVKDYDYLGTIKTSGVISFGDAQYSGVRDKLIKKCKKDFPNAEGIIFTFKSGGADKADAIKFK